MQATVGTVSSPSEPSHYFSTDPGAPSRRRQVELVLPEGRLVRLVTDRGVFSADRIDAGTKVLLASTGPLDRARTLVDVGCGYGPIAVSMALRADEGATVWAVDVNERARDLCAENAEANGVGDRVRVVAPEDVPADLVVDRIWSNPPIRIGKHQVHDLLSGWLDRLAADGRASLVVQRNLGSDSLARWLGDRGWAVERITSRAGYRVLDVSRGPATPDPVGGALVTRSAGQHRPQAPAPTLAPPGPGRVALLLDSVATPFNVGAILRTAAALRVEDVYVCGQTADEHASGTQKTALGSQRYPHVPLGSRRPAEAVAAVVAAGYRLVGIELAQGARPIHEVDLTGAVCLAVGHEDRGLSSAVADAADALAFIPQLGRIGSLNVATAASIALYETRRQSWPDDAPD